MVKLNTDAVTSGGLSDAKNGNGAVPSVMVIGTRRRSTVSTDGRVTDRKAMQKIEIEKSLEIILGDERKVSVYFEVISNGTLVTDLLHHLGHGQNHRP